MKVSSPPETNEELLRSPLPPLRVEGQKKPCTCAGSSGPFSLRYGLPCPFCQVGYVDYDSQFNLVCGNCGKTQTGAFT